MALLLRAEGITRVRPLEGGIDAEGITRVRPLEGGIDAWLASNFPFVTESLANKPVVL